ncbi:MAG: hypothetical protein E7105_11050 [Prevotella sp.]|nr:hypothetical protein [Prevotella sp.]
MQQVNMKLTEHFTLAEMCKTSVNLKNVPNEAQIENLKRVCWWLELLRSRYNERYGDGDDPIVINSGYRSEEVNKAVGGAPTSNHLTGCAADIRVSGMEQALRYAVILLDISDESREDLTSSRVCSHSAKQMQASLCARSTADFDELLIERNARGAIWLHFAVRASGNRRKLRFIG